MELTTRYNMEEQLIKVVRDNACLYDVKHPDYVRHYVKHEIWNQIAQEIGYKDGSKAKKAWESLRTNHRDALRRQKRRVVCFKPWRFQKSMEFLLPYMGKRLKKSVNPDDKTSDGTSSGEEESVNDKTNLSIDESQDMIARKRRRLMSEEHQREDDPLYHFFMSMYESTKKMPPLAQHDIKTKIFNIVTGAEIHNVAECSAAKPHSSHTQTYDSDGGTSSSSTPEKGDSDNVLIIKEEVPDSVYYITEDLDE